jgi:hypothetical protein
MQKGSVLRRNLPFEHHASKIYTPTMFKKFGEILYEAGAYRVEEIEKNKAYLTKHFDAESREKWNKGAYEVKMVDNGELFICECVQFEHMGLLCYHALKVIWSVYLLHIIHAVINICVIRCVRCPVLGNGICGHNSDSKEAYYKKVD